jgi:hypothetical protein
MTLLMARPTCKTSLPNETRLPSQADLDKVGHANRIIKAPNDTGSTGFRQGDVPYSSWPRIPLAFLTQSKIVRHGKELACLLLTNRPAGLVSDISCLPQNDSPHSDKPRLGRVASVSTQKPYLSQDACGTPLNRRRTIISLA